jgi:hypothetical protein
MGVKYGDFYCVEPARLLEQLQSAPLAPLPVDVDTLSRCNRFTCPLRAWPGAGRVLLRLEDYLKLEPDTGPYDLVFFDDSTKQPKRFKNIYAIRAQCVTPGWEDDPRSVYAVELADWRYFAMQKHVSQGYNVLNCDTGEMKEETLDGGSGSGGSGSGEGDPWSWTRLGADLWSYLGRSEAWPGWPAGVDPDSVPNSWEFWQVPGIVALDAVAWILGCALRWDPFRDVVDIVRLGADDAAFSASVERLKQKDRRWDEYWQEPDKPRTPAKVRVLFRRAPRGADNNPYEHVDVDYPDADLRALAEAGTQALVYDDLMALDASKMATRAATRANDYHRLYGGWWPRLHRHYRGVTGPDDLFLGSKCGVVTLEDTGAGVMTIIDGGDWPPIPWEKYLPPCTCECTETTGSGSGSDDGGSGDGSGSGDPCESGVRVGDLIRCTADGAQIDPDACLYIDWDNRRLRVR